MDENTTLDDILSVKPTGDGIIALVDGDIVAHRAANATDGRVYNVKDLPGAWKYKKDVERHCREHEIPFEDIILNFEPEPLKNALSIVKLTMRTIEQALEARHGDVKFEVYLSVPSNELWRKELNPEYKDNRKGARKPHHLDACKEYLMKKWKGIREPLHEADDLLALRAEQLGDEPWVICSIDKDLMQIPGDHFDWTNDRYVTVSKAEALRCLWYQVLIGDSTDNIHTPRLLGKKYANDTLDIVDDWDNVDVKFLRDLCEHHYKLCMEKYMKVTDTTDAACWVLQTYEQVKLGRQGGELCLW